MDNKKLYEQEVNNTQPLVCRLCFEITFAKDTVGLKDFSQHILKTALNSIIDLGLTEYPVACSTCIATLTRVYNFKLRCLQNETMFRAFIEKQVNDIKVMPSLHSFVSSNRNNLSRFCHCSNPLTCLKVEPRSVEVNSIKKGEKLEEKPVEIIPKTLPVVSTIDDKNNLTIEQVILNWFPEDEDTTDFKSEKSSISSNDTGSSGSWSTTNCKLENSSFTATSATASTIVTNPSNYKCHQCPYRSPNRLSVSKHVLNIHRREPLTCLFCEKTFKQKINLDSHLLNKHDDMNEIETFVTNRIHRCSHCLYRTVNSFNLDRHLVVKHKNNLRKWEKVRKFQIYKCKLCKYSTTNKGNLTTHIRTHDKEKQFKCRFCRKGYNQKYNLQLHILRHHGQEADRLEEVITCKLYACENCEFKALLKGQLAKHVIRQHR